MCILPFFVDGVAPVNPLYLAFLTQLSHMKNDGILIDLSKHYDSGKKGVVATSVHLISGIPLASELAWYPVVLKLDDWLFCHGRLLPHPVMFMRRSLLNAY
jgi:hypothetical protein